MTPRFESRFSLIYATLGPVSRYIPKTRTRSVAESEETKGRVSRVTTIAILASLTISRPGGEPSPSTLTAYIRALIAPDDGRLGSSRLKSALDR